MESWWRRAGWRWALVAGMLAALGLLPAALAARPVTVPHLSPTALLERVAESEQNGYSGLVESGAHLGFPDVQRAERLAELLGERHRMRVWYRAPDAWRVDELTPIGERDNYMDSGGLWAWDSGRETVARVKGSPTVRFLRPADLLPPELGRRAAAAVDASSILAPLPGRRIAGAEVPGVRIEPTSPGTTIERIDMWVHPATGLALAVEVVPRGTDDPMVASQFLDFDPDVPPEGSVRFVFPEGASYSFTTAPDFAAAVDRYSPFVLPDEMGGLRRRSSVAGAAGTFGEGFELVAVLALSERFSPFGASELAHVPTISGAWGTGHLVETPLFNALTFERGGIRFILGGTVTRSRLERAATTLAGSGSRVIE
jgi:hypothetical protein